MLLHPSEFHFDKHSNSRKKKSHTSHLNCMHTSMSIYQNSKNSFQEFPNVYKQNFPVLNTTYIDKGDFESPINEEVSLCDYDQTDDNDQLTHVNSHLETSNITIDNPFKIKTENQLLREKTQVNIKTKQEIPEEVNLISVNSHRQLIYTLLYEDKNKLDGLPIGSTEVLYEFTELITIMVHIDSVDAILFCGSPHLYLWSIKQKKIIFIHRIDLEVDPWFIIWDAVFIKHKSCLVLSLSNGNVLQIRFNLKKMSFEEMKIFQSNEEGLGVYGLAYVPSVAKIFATNCNNLITEFKFVYPKKSVSKNALTVSSRYIPINKVSSIIIPHMKSIKNINIHQNKSYAIKTMSNLKNTNSTFRNKYLYFSSYFALSFIS